MTSATVAQSDTPRRLSPRERPPIPLAAILHRPVNGSDIAREAGCTPGFVSRVLTGERLATRAVRQAACRLLAMDEVTLFGDTLDR